MPPIKKIISDAIALHVEHHDGRNRDFAKQAVKEQIRSLIHCKKKLRATDPADKEARRASILDAADSLFKRTHEFANVSEVANAAGLAKGTVYLYFQTKEEIYLALHMRNAQAFFDELISDLETRDANADLHRMTFARMRELVVKHMLANDMYFPLVACCVGLPHGSVPQESALATKETLTQWLLRAGAGLERHFPQLKPGEGVRLLNHSYAMMIGLFHLLFDPAHAPQRPDAIGLGSFRDEALLALERYWQAALGDLSIR